MRTVPSEDEEGSAPNGWDIPAFRIAFESMLVTDANGLPVLNADGSYMYRGVWGHRTTVHVPTLDSSHSIFESFKPEGACVCRYCRGANGKCTERFIGEHAEDELSEHIKEKHYYECYLCLNEWGLPAALEPLQRASLRGPLLHHIKEKHGLHAFVQQFESGPYKNRFTVTSETEGLTKLVRTVKRGGIPITSKVRFLHALRDIRKSWVLEGWSPTCDEALKVNTSELSIGGEPFIIPELRYYEELDLQRYTQPKFFDELERGNPVTVEPYTTEAGGKEYLYHQLTITTPAGRKYTLPLGSINVNREVLTLADARRHCLRKEAEALRSDAKEAWKEWVCKTQACAPWDEENYKVTPLRVQGDTSVFDPATGEQPISDVTEESIVAGTEEQRENDSQTATEDNGVDTLDIKEEVLEPEVDPDALDVDEEDDE
jgi:hypothetical protein